MKRAETRIEEYIEAVRAHRALLLATTLDGHTEQRDRLVKQAAAQVTERIRCLTGGQIGQAQRMLKETTP